MAPRAGDPVAVREAGRQPLGGGAPGRGERPGATASVSATILAPITAPSVDPRDRAHPTRLLSALLRATLAASLIAYQREMTLDELGVVRGDGLAVD
jgi:hypothetical protein